MVKKFKEGDLVVSPAGEIFEVLYFDGKMTLNGHVLTDEELKLFRLIEVDEEEKEKIKKEVWGELKED